MSDKINVEAILEKHGVMDVCIGMAKNAVKEIVEAVIDKCAEKVEFENLDESILNVKKQIEY